MRLYYYRRMFGTAANPHIIFVFVGNWSSRNLKHRGMIPETWFTSRKATEAEISTFHPYRMSCYRYKTWEGLIEDEVEILGADHPFIKELYAEFKGPDWNGQLDIFSRPT